MKSDISKKNSSFIRFSVSKGDIQMPNEQGKRNNLLNFRANKQKNELKQTVFSSVQPKILNGYYDKRYDFES